MKGIIRLLLFLIAVIIFVAGLAGFVPGLSTILGTNKPKDFGIKITPADTTKAQEKSGVVLVELPKDTPIANSYILEGQRAASFTYDSTEATAIINNRPWKYYPFSNLQLRLNSDGSAEISGMVNMTTFMDYANSLGYATGDVEKALNDYHIPKINMPFYAKGSAGIIDNKVFFNVTAFEAGRVPVPSSILSSNKGRIESFAQDVVGRQKGFSAKKLVVENGKIVFDGTLPEKESVVYK
jgi:hypothetical protein